MTTDPGTVAADFLQELLEAIGLHVEVELDRRPDGTYWLTAIGPDADFIPGPNGSTINAIQYLVGLVTLRRAGQYIRLVVDADNYRARREQTLTEMARQYAAQVKRTGQECVLDPLNPFERRIVHTALLDDPDVITYSEGDEPDRCVVISPRRPA
ncbi:MAG: protein jag [Armatimonadetes bacterium]|nr:protein jag [Armatimonadota bacterium]